MKPQTREHLERAAENRETAEQIVADSASTPGLIRWACVMTFYAALQYVNAYLVEQWDAAPRTHDQRETSMLLFKSVLRPVDPQYRTLKEKASRARYDAKSQFTTTDVRSLLETELQAIRVAVLNNLPS